MQAQGETQVKKGVIIQEKERKKETDDLTKTSGSTQTIILKG